MTACFVQHHFLYAKQMQNKSFININGPDIANNNNDFNNEIIINFIMKSILP